MRASVAVATNRSYASGWAQWVKHRVGIGAAVEGDPDEVGCYDPKEDELMRFVAELSMERKGKAKGLTERTVRSYLAAITHRHLVKMKRDPRQDLVFLPKMMVGVKRMRGAATKPKRPITLSLLKEMKKHVRKEGARAVEKAAVWAAMCMGVHGLFRLGELLPPKGERAPLTVGRRATSERRARNRAPAHLEDRSIRQRRPREPVRDRRRDVPAGGAP